jgi:3-deoxy-manno-octulosonate cytidylyltransferase (CMP-KDO synthetase)
MESTRFPGKPLAPIKGEPMIIHCAKNAIMTGIRTIVCTDSEMIRLACKDYKVEVIETPYFDTGTDRIAWAAAMLENDLVINLQGDEPLIHAKAITSFLSHIASDSCAEDVIWNGVTSIEQKSAFDPNNVKAVVDNAGNVLYLTRKPIRNSIDPDVFPIYLKQLGLYGFSKEILIEFASMANSRLEKSESVEMLRWLENGKRLVSVNLGCMSISVDTPEDLIEAERMIREI